MLYEVITGGSEGVVGERDYNARLTGEQLTWLQRDLATITDDNTRNNFV